MPRQQKVSVTNNFSKGLITETTALQFPQDACTETFNCVFDKTGRVTRRLGFDVELPESDKTITTNDSLEAYTEFVWTSVGGNGNRTFLVQQQGRFLHFFNISNGTNVNQNFLTTIDISGFVPSGSPFSPDRFPCQYASGKGNLVVVSAVINPILITFDDAVGFDANAILIRQRDFVGLDDGLEIDERPAIDPQDLDTNNPEHLYNLINQGWYVGGAFGSGMGDAEDILNQWSVARPFDSPSNADVPSLYRDTTTVTGGETPGLSDVFNPNYVPGLSTGNTEAPKGHFILDVFDPDRIGVMGTEGYTVSLDTNFEISTSVGSVLNGGFNNAGNAFDGAQTSAPVACAEAPGPSGFFIGKSYSPALRISQVTVHGSTSGYNPSVAGESITIELRAKNGSFPLTGGAGTLLGTVTFTDLADESVGRTITSSDTSTFWEHVWVSITSPAPIGTLDVAEVRFFSVGSGASGVNAEPSTIQRPVTTAFFAGRAWYAGVDSPGRSTALYFTRIIEKDNQYGECFQRNDPTNEHFTDLLPSDGGVIRIPEVGSVKKIFAYQTSLLVFANNGVWLISGSSQEAFQANDFQVRKLSSIGTNSSLSFVDVKGVPFWWAVDGIYTITFDANYNSFAVVSITDNTIKSFLDNVSSVNRAYVKGCYDVLSTTIQWIYSETDFGDSLNPYTYDKVITYDAITKAFSPWVISTPAANPPSQTRQVKVRGICSISTSAQNQIVKYTISGEVPGNDATRMAFAEIRNETLFDWVDYGTSSDYLSYGVSGYAFDGETQRFFQPNYVFVFVEPIENGSCFFRGIFDFALAPSTGKWSQKQQVYNQNLLNRSVNYRRLKVRGKGRALQFRFESETGKPFAIIGWSNWNTSNAGL